MAVAHRLGAEVADARLDVHPAIRLDDEQAVVAGRARDKRARRHAVAADFGSLTLAALHLARVPAEETRSAVERFLHERARRVGALTAWVGRTEFRFPF